MKWKSYKSTREGSYNLRKQSLWKHREWKALESEESMRLREEIYNKELLRIKESGLKEKSLPDKWLKNISCYLKETPSSYLLIRVC